jgi:8-hydroxy-5-deazaflavin:NADPH oxidoreductase
MLRIVWFDPRSGDNTMKIGIIGGGSVGQTIATKLIANGHDVLLGIRNPTPDELAKERQFAKPLTEWIAATGGKVVTFAEAAKHGEIVFNVTNGDASIAALTMAGAENLDGKVLIDVANPLDFSRGMPPDLLAKYSQFTSLGEEVQKAFPKARVVKAFNTVSAFAMVDAAFVPGDHDLFIAGNDPEAKKTVEGLARKEFGWKSFVDLGDIVGARASEHLLPLWVRLWMIGGSPKVNLKLMR